MPTSNDSTQYISSQLVSAFYAIKILDFIVAELRDNTTTQFSFEHVMAQTSLVEMSLNNMMNEVID
ncbi:MAG: hypothetical protein COA83_09625 [Methylophaga sp.]|nr:MAG: hypothetical protein COA83_09625 [Methylophaga sp.]